MSLIQRVLVIGYVWPEPNSSAAGTHMLSLLRLFIQQGWQLTFASPAQRGEHKVDLTALGIEEQAIALNCDSFDAFIQRLQPDMVLFDRFMLEEQFGWRVAQHCPDALRVIDTEDLHSLRQARHQAHKAGTPVEESALNTPLSRREVAAIYRSDLSLIISAAEKQLLEDYYRVPPSQLLHCPFMLDTQEITTPPGLNGREHFVSIGNFRHAPNWDAVLHLKQTLWPAIRKQLPRTKLHIYGAYPPPKATQLHNPRQGFLVKGWAEDARTVVSQARVLLAPLRFGAGLKGKLAEAMLCGTPSVTTSIGAEGMAGDHPWPGAVTGSDGDFIDAAIRLYQDDAAWQHAHNRGLPLIRANFDGSAIGTQLISRINAVKAALNSHRELHFVGAMLNQHHHQSTKYMAQWIAAKNRP